MTRRDLPNLISVLRMLLVLPVVALLVTEHYRGALLLFGLAGLSDALDGFLAKRYGWTSRLGAVLDPLADKILLVSSYIALGWLRLLPLWLVAAVIVRDLVIVIGAAGYWVRVERLDIEPSRLSKLNTLTQIILVLAVVFHQGVVALPALSLRLLVYAVLVTTLLSGVDYVWTWGRRACRAGRERHV